MVLFLAFTSDRYHVFLKFHCIFQCILFVGFQYVFVQHFLLHVFLSFSTLSSIGFCTISSGFLHFHTFSILILIQEFYLTPSFSDPFCTISSRCYHIFLHFHCIFPTCFTASSWFAPSIRSGFLHFPRDFPWFVPGIRAVFVRFPGDFCTIFLWSLSCFLQFHWIFQYILMVSPATKKADLGGIDTPPSANYLVVHNPEKCSVFWRSTQGHGEILFPFGNHPPPHPLFSTSFANSKLAS